MSSVAITNDRFEKIASIYRDRGLEPVPIPCVHVEVAGEQVLSDAREAAADADLILISSARIIALLWPDGEMPDVEVAVVGEATADAVRRAGGRVAVTGCAGLLDLIDAVVDRLRRARVVFPHAGGTDLAASRRIREISGTIEEHLVYRTAPRAAGPTRVDAAAFASPSAVQGWLLTRDLDDVVVGVIGPTTAAAVARIRPPDVVAPRPAHRCLAMALDEHLEAKQ
jgi:uroporphyrinogen-III synthase